MSLDSVADVLIGLAALGLVVFGVLYWRYTRWRRTPLGRHMFYFVWAFVFAYAVAVARQWYPEQDWLDVVRLFSLTLVILVVWQRVYLLVKSIRHRADPDELHRPDNEKGA